MSKTQKEFGKGKNEFANLPQDVVHTTYPKGEHISSDIDDTMTGIDSTISKTISKSKKHPSYQK